MKTDNTSLSSLTTEMESKSKTSSFSSINNSNLAKTCDWLNDLLELHYFAYNSCNSLTIYSYKYWPQAKRLIVSTKENNIKEIFFNLVVNEDDNNLEQHGNIGGGKTFSTQSSLSSGNSSSNTRHASANNDDLIGGNPPRKGSLETKSNMSMNDSDGSYLEPVYKIHKLPKIKGDALISAIDIFEINNFTVLVVAFALKRKPEKYYLHIYCDFETTGLELITECEHEFELNSMPHRVTNLKHFKASNETEQSKKISSSSLIFVNCSQKINLLYSIDPLNRKFNVVKKIEDYFIEMSTDILNDNISSHDIKYLCSNLQNTSSQKWIDRRLTAIGTQHGWLGVFLVDSIKNEILKQWEYENDSFLIQLQLFTTKSTNDWTKIDIDKVHINLLALRSLEPTRIFSNVLHSEDSFESYQDLEISSSSDLVTSAVIYDATFSGYNSIVLGTFGRNVLFFCPRRSSLETSEYGNESSNKHQTLTARNQTTISASEQQLLYDSSYRRQLYQFSYELKREIVFKHSVLGLSVGLLSNNGALDLMILSLNGVSVWQYDPEKVIELANKMFEQREQLDHFKESQTTCSNNDLTTSF